MRTAVIVDAERLGRLELRRLLAAVPDVSVVGEAPSLSEGREGIARLRPDIVLLDGELGTRAGVELLEELSAATEVILITADDEGLAACARGRAAAVLPKPVSPRRLCETLARL